MALNGTKDAFDLESWIDEICDVTEIQRRTKRVVCFAKQDPGRARQSS